MDDFQAVQYGVQLDNAQPPEFISEDKARAFSMYFKNSCFSGILIPESTIKISIKRGEKSGILVSRIISFNDFLKIKSNK